jgi:hypothetical protein
MLYFLLYYLQFSVDSLVIIFMSILFCEWF